MTKKNGTKENGPVYSKRIGLVRVSIFENAHEGRTYHNVTVSRRYRDGDEWKDTNSLNGLADVACLKEALQHATAWLNARDDEQNAAAEE